jgi:rhamnogalacturonyl hydrolase YesR
MLLHGRDRYGPKNTPLFVGQLNVKTRRMPTGDRNDPGLLKGNAATAGTAHFCQNLMFDLGLLDTLEALTRLTGDQRYESARRDYLEYFLGHCRHPRSGYLPWGEHVGFDVIHACPYYTRDNGNYHEVKAIYVPWDGLWEVNPQAIRHEIEVAFRRHICDEATFAFNRHASMEGDPNTGTSPTSLADSGGLYLAAWAWLYRKTGDRKFLEWAQKMNRFFRSKRSPTTGLLPTSEDRPNESWYYTELPYACLLLQAASCLGPVGEEFRGDAIEYFESYSRYAYDPEGPGFFDTLDIRTGKPVIGASRDLPGYRRPKYQCLWTRIPNSVPLAALASLAGIAYEATGNPAIRRLCDRALDVLAIEKHIGRATPMKPGDIAGVLFAITCVLRRSKDSRYLRLGQNLADYAMERNRNHGFFTSSEPGQESYYFAREGGNDLPAALLAFVLTKRGLEKHAPSPRHLFGTLPW